ncbi:hypothetical protein OG394_34845 [Kribbella sp. NBC_01245]|uniref:hypothetical protein n=1 Tax=Kribbella sp. NBC_01245 TaxID=2903578 RepID=UPI002E2B57F5|nr:hypothetical protein [Kribbella sp. NBC_01245]
MNRLTPDAPPRPIAVGDVVVAFNDLLGEWTAAQVTHFHEEWKSVALLELTWSGPEPAGIDDLGVVEALKLSHQSWGGGLSHCFFEWILPRSHKIIGTMPVLQAKPPSSYSAGWRIGDQLFYQRRWDSGNRDEFIDPAELSCTGAELNALSGPRQDLRILRVAGIDELDCKQLVESYPDLTELILTGNLGILANAGSLNRLTRLKSLIISDLFGMDGPDCLLPKHVPALENLWLSSVPRDYASATRTAWRGEIVHGVSLEIQAPRKPEWVAENLNNPLRDWDGRERISALRYKKALALYRTTRRAVQDAFANASGDARLARLTEIGRGFSEGFNKLDGRDPFIETVERDELFAALNHLITEVGGMDDPAARDALLASAEANRDW